MAIELEYDPERQFLRVTLADNLLLEELTSAFDQMTRSPDYPPDVDTLWDLRNADLSKTDAEFWQALIRTRENDYRERRNFKLALVASGDFAFGMLRMYEMLSEARLDRELMVFKDIDQAERWLTQKTSAPEPPKN